MSLMSGGMRRKDPPYAGGGIPLSDRHNASKAAFLGELV
jgi:hypothetical protein